MMHNTLSYEDDVSSQQKLQILLTVTGFITKSMYKYFSIVNSQDNDTLFERMHI